ncbi:hypothetical protein B0H66DRAFT_17089 [Apodospora peruviana]|uniref:NADPH-dependent 1-acyldihydroxyacetone phosphate reductase n=1 Tax=Apodospora peruviana TaxID=516989 RepID=A0AAE0IQB8_9PEZI|nr:hypothetical protein B0H66DRAFT_17089 [Apodospora peruviana]
MVPPKKSVLITGCSAGGIGAALAFSFQKRGFLVFATTRNTAKIPTTLTSLPNVVVVQLDVTSQSSVDAAAQSVRTTLLSSSEGGGNKENEIGLDILINNSGLGSWGPILDTSIDDAKAQFDVNFFGVIRVTQAFADLLVKAKGTLINTSSLSGIMWEPYKSIYGASKAALTQASETWRLELEPLGVRVVTLNVGQVKSEFFSDLPTEMKLPGTSYYLPVKERLDRMLRPDWSTRAPDTTAFAEQVVGDILGGKTGLVWRGGYSTMAKFFHLLPTWLMVGFSPRLYI